jgi:hypothetical protein
MRKEQGTSDWKPNPYFESLSKEISFRLDFGSIEYFEKLGKIYGLPAEEMIYMYLRHIADSGYKANLGILTLKEREELKASLQEQGKLPSET